MLKINNKKLNGKIYFANNTFKKGFGLMFKTGFENKFLIFNFNKERIISLHMLFVFFPIDVIFLNKEKKVVEIKRNFKPFSFYLSSKKACYFIETEKGIFDKVRINDKIDW